MTIGPVRAAGPAGEPATVGARLFGPIEVAAGGRRLGPRDLGGPKAKQVLELLLVARGHNVTKDRLADQLWGEALPNAWVRPNEAHQRRRRRRGLASRHP